jgi:hypothetical protein
MDIKDIIKELNHICEDIYELHNLFICNKLFKLNKFIKPHISNELYMNYNKEVENVFFDSFISAEIGKNMNEIIYLISQIIMILNKIILNYP